MADIGFDDDRRLVEACLRKDMAAWAIFVKKYSPLISASIDARLKKYGIGASVHDTEEMSQAVLTSIWRKGKLKTIRNRRDISYWLAIVSGNIAADYMRKERRDASSDAASLSQAAGEDELIELIPSSAATPVQELSGKEAIERIGRAIGSLPVKEKLVVKLTVLSGKNYRETAEILGLPEGTVACYVKRAKERLRKILKYL